MLIFCHTIDETQSLEQSTSTLFFLSFLFFATKDGIIFDSTLNNSTNTSLKTKKMDCHLKVLADMKGKLKIHSVLS